MSEPFAVGDPCLIFDAKGRRYLIELVAGREFQYHRGVLAHDEIIGAQEGSRLESSLGMKLVVLRPRLADYTLKMSRKATVVYPKDAGAILMWADIGPGQVVLEAGTGSGALTMALARAVDPGGTVISLERREDHHERARQLIRGFYGSIPPTIDLRVGEVEDVIAAVAPDRIVLDVPEPWHSVPLAGEHLGDGGVFCCYLPTVPQCQTVREALTAAGTYLDVMTFEVLMREWSVEGRSVRPEHRMIGHTGFITVARKVAAKP
jgi:tRNA (adenine57-N1/adenine58-N1)-methyltransferase